MSLVLGVRVVSAGLVVAWHLTDPVAPLSGVPQMPGHGVAGAASG